MQIAKNAPAHLSHNDVEFCRKIEKRFGTSYYLATRFLPLEKRYATYALYSFFRLPDEIVDTEQGLTNDAKRIKLAAFRKEWADAYGGLQEPENPAIRAALWAHKRFSIPFEYSQIFLDAMEMDIETSRYKTYRDLVGYMDGSASAVGLMMSYVIGFTGGETTLDRARKLGEAMQLTNFLRDVGEDYRERGRIYLPQDDMDRHGVTEECIADLVTNNVADSIKQEKMRELLVFEIKRARELYRVADGGIPFLHRDGRYAVRLASRLYEAILDEIERNDYNVYTQRVRTSSARKIMIAIKALLG